MSSSLDEQRGPASFSKEAGPSADSAPAGARRLRPESILQFVGKFALPVTLVAMFLLFSQLTSTFLSSANINNMLDQAVVPLVLACGVTFVLSVGEFDLAFTAVIGLAAATPIVLMARHGVGWQLAALTVIPLGLVVGAIIGLLVTFGRASSFIVTLAVGSAVTGVELALTGNQTIYQNIPAGFSSLTDHKIAGVHQTVWFALIIVIILAGLLHATRFGRHVQSLGGNAHAAHLAGIRVRRVRIICFVISAVLASLAALVLTSRASSYYPNTSASFLLSTYTAVFLGATAGRTSNFTIGGSVLGVVWIIVLQTGLTLNSAPTWVAALVQGGVLALAVIIGSRIKSRA